MNTAVTQKIKEKIVSTVNLLIFYRATKRNSPLSLLKHPSLVQFLNQWFLSKMTSYLCMDSFKKS